MAINFTNPLGVRRSLRNYLDYVNEHKNDDL